MAILNYTTSINVDKTSAEINRKLVSAGASAVMCEYSPGGILIGIAFKINTSQGEISFRLPANIEKVHAAMVKDKKVPKNLKTMEQASRVAWRILKDWIEAQVAIIQADMVTISEVFLPYAQTNTGETVYERMTAQGFNQLTHQPEQRR